jgi:Na+/serine symporter
MHYDQSWMGYGMVGGLEAGAISAVAAILLYLIMHAIGRQQGWSPLKKITIAFLLALLLTASGDMWDLFYFNYGQLQSMQLLKAKLAQVHDPDNIGLRVFSELIGAMVGAGAGWIILGGDWRRVLRGED